MATTLGVSKELSRTGELIHLHSDPGVFAQAIARRSPAGVGGSWRRNL